MKGMVVTQHKILKEVDCIRKPQLKTLQQIYHGKKGYNDMINIMRSNNNLYHHTMCFIIMCISLLLVPFIKQKSPTFCIIEHFMLKNLFTKIN